MQKNISHPLQILLIFPKYYSDHQPSFNYFLTSCLNFNITFTDFRAFFFQKRVIVFLIFVYFARQISSWLHNMFAKHSYIIFRAIQLKPVVFFVVEKWFGEFLNIGLITSYFFCCCWHCRLCCLVLVVWWYCRYRCCQPFNWFVVVLFFLQSILCCMCGDFHVVLPVFVSFYVYLYIWWSNKFYYLMILDSLMQLLNSLWANV